MTEIFLESDTLVVERVIISSIGGFFFLICCFFVVKHLKEIKRKRARKAAEIAARNPPPFSIALTMELNSKPVLPPNYYDVIKGNLRLTSEKIETNEKPPPPFEDV